MISSRRVRQRQAVVEDGLTLNIDQLILIPGSRISGRIDWSNRMVEPAASVEYESQLALPNAYLRLYFAVRDSVSGSSHLVRQEIRLTTSSPRFGGVRWWFICPHSGARVGRLHLPPGSSLFAGRQAYALRYACQTENRHQRAARRASKLIARLGGRPDPYFPPDRPKRMRWSTYAKKVNELRRFKTWLYG